MIKLDKKGIIAFAEIKDHADLFLRFQDAAYRGGFLIVYVTARYSVYKYIKKRCKYNNVVLFLKKQFADKEIRSPDLCQDLELKLGVGIKIRRNEYTRRGNLISCNLGTV